MKAQFEVSSVGDHSADRRWIALVATRDGNEDWAWDDSSGYLRGDLNLFVDNTKDQSLFVPGKVLSLEFTDVTPVEEVTPSPSTPSDAPPADATPTPSPETPDPAPAADPSVVTGDPSSSSPDGPSTTTTDSAESSPPADSSSTA